MNKLLEKVIALLLVITLAGANLAILGSYTIAYALTESELAAQTTQTQSSNVEFNAYFAGGSHVQTENVDSKEAKLYVNVKVKNAGYLKNAEISFKETNFKINGDIQNNNIQRVDTQNNSIILNQIDNGSDVTIEVPISILNDNQVPVDNFSKETKTVFNGTYIDGSGKEKTVSKEIINKLSWKGVAELKIDSELTKYIPYATGEKYGVMVQEKVLFGIADSTLPVKDIKLSIKSPEINGLNPTNVFVTANNTMATNGQTDGLNFTSDNYSYDSTTGITTINTTNGANSDNNIYWNKNVQDEYLVTFMFEGQEIYNYANTNGINSKTTIDANVEMYNSEQTVLEKSTQFDIQTNTKLGTIADFDINTISKVGKGQIYANYDTSSKAETSYWVEYSSTVNSADLTENIEFAQGVDKFLTSENVEALTTVSGNNYVYNKNVKISEAIFKKMLGEDGSISILDTQGNSLVTIDKNSSKDENGNYLVDISSFNNNQLVVRTSKPVTQGKITLQIEKAFKGNIDYSKEQVSTFTKMKAELVGKASTSTVTTSKEFLLKEPTSVAELTTSKKDLTTVVKNENVEIRATLDTSNIDNALYTNPTLKIKLPSYISKVDLKEKSILMDNGLKIKNAKVVQDGNTQVIEVVLEGKQTGYTIGTEYKGTIVVLNTDLTVDTLTPTNTSNITMEYTNGNTVSTNAKGNVETQINFVAPTGLVAAHGVSNYAEGKSNLLSISDEQVTATLDTYSGKKVATIQGTIINNYSNDIENIVVLGRFPVAGNKKIDTNEELGSNCSTTLNSNIVLTGLESSNYTVYYSEKLNATMDIANSNNGWSEVATTNAKSYMIVTNNYKMQPAQKIEFAYNVEIPANLTHNNNVYEMYKVYYNNNSNIGRMAETKVSPVIEMTTGQGPELTAQVSSDMQTVREGQFVKMKVTVNNTGAMTAENVKVNINVPKYTKFATYQFYSGFTVEEEATKVINVGKVEAGKTVTVPYYLKIDDDTSIGLSEEDLNNITDEELDLIDEQNKFPKEIVSKVTITGDKLSNEIPSNEYKLTLQEGKISLDMVCKLDENQVLHKGDVIDYYINLSNISCAGELTGTVVTIPLPEQLTYKSATIKADWEDTTGTTEGIVYNESTNTVQVNVGNLRIYKLIVLEVEAKETSESFSVMAKATADGAEEHVSNVINHMAEKIDLEVSELTSTPKYVKESEYVTYNFKVTNKGKSRITNLKIVDELPNELLFEKATYSYNGKEEKVAKVNNNKVDITINQLLPEESTNISIVARAQLLADKNDKEVSNKVSVSATGLNTVDTNQVTNIIEYYEEAHEAQKPNQPTNTKKRYKVTGTAWVDSNKDGKRDNSEEILPNVSVMLVYKDNNKIVRDPDTNKEKRTTTGNDGKYQFDNLPVGEYLVVFVYDASRYSLTTYQAKGVDSGLNSDAIDINITVDGERKIAGITDIIKITNSNVRDIDIGLYSSEKFDLRLDKYISKVTLTTPTIGTKTYTYDKKQTTKTEVLSQNLGKSNIVIEYKIVVTNEGAVAGYAKKIVDYLPEGVGFNTELNKDWYLSENGNVYNSSLANEKINPGESKEITLVVTKKITESSLGVLNNNAEIYESYNELGLKDIDSTPGNKDTQEDDMSKADIVLSLVTGKIIMYTTILLGVVVLIGFGVYEIKKRVLNNKRN